jgi:hypothetical protein
MKRRITKRPIASIAVVVGCLLIGLSLSPVGAQSGLVNGQVTVRSDGAVYLISNGQRRWVATVVISDDELNAYPEAEPIYSGLAPLGSASAGTAPAGTTAAPKTAPPAASASPTTSATPATTTGSTPSSGTTAPKTTGSSAAPSQSTDNATPGQVIADPASGADPKDPNDPTLADAGVTAQDPNAKAAPLNDTECPASHRIKGGFDKYYWDTDRPDYATVKPEACFVSGAFARAFGYTEIKKKPGSSSTPR